jgi:hypothetical protein
MSLCKNCKEMAHEHCDRCGSSKHGTVITIEKPKANYKSERDAVIIIAFLEGIVISSLIFTIAYWVFK